MTQTQPLIDKGRLPTRALTDAETYLKKQTFKVEAVAVQRLQALYKEAYRDIAATIDDTANMTQSWRAPVESFTAGRVLALKRDVLLLVTRYTQAVYVGNYYGRLWLLDVSTAAHVPISAPPVNTAQLQEDIYDQLIQDLLGEEWRAKFALEMDDLTLQIRRAIGSGLQNQESISAIQRRVRDAMGVSTDRRRGAVGTSERAGYKANFNRVQTLTRTVVQTVANNGSIRAYRANGDAVGGYEWLTANDERVCPICFKLDGKRFGLKSNFRPPAHPNCRCSLSPVLKADMTGDISTPPREALPQWVQKFGLQRELDDFLNPKA